MASALRKHARRYLKLVADFLMVTFSFLSIDSVCKIYVFKMNIHF